MIRVLRKQLVGDKSTKKTTNKCGFKSKPIKEIKDWCGLIKVIVI